MDALQSWVISGPVTGMTVENNTFIEWNSPVVNPLRCALQGIGFFDGPYQNPPQSEQLSRALLLKVYPEAGGTG